MAVYSDCCFLLPLFACKSPGKRITDNLGLTSHWDFSFHLIKILLAEALISIIIKYSSGTAAIVHSPSWNTLK